MRTDDDTDTDAIARRVATQRAMANEHAHVLACASLALCAPKAWEDAANVTNASAEDARARRERREVSRAWRAARDEETARRRAEEDAREEDARAARRRDLVGERRAREARVRRRVETRREATRAEKEKTDGRLERQASKAANAAMIEMFQVRARGRVSIVFSIYSAVVNRIANQTTSSRIKICETNECWRSRSNSHRLETRGTSPVVERRRHTARVNPPRTNSASPRRHQGVSHSFHDHPKARARPPNAPNDARSPPSPIAIETHQGFSTPTVGRDGC